MVKRQFGAAAQTFGQAESAAGGAGEQYPAVGLMTPTQTKQQMQWAYDKANSIGPALVSSLPPQEQDALAHVGNTLEIPMTLLGAAQMDALQGNHRSNELLKQGLSTLAGPGSLFVNPGPNLKNALFLLRHAEFGRAADLYSTTSLIANDRRAQLGDVGAKFFRQHPRVFGLTAGAEEFFNPANIAAGDLTAGFLKWAGRGFLNRFADAADAGARADRETAAAGGEESARQQRAARARQAQANARNAAAWQQRMARERQFREAVRTEPPTARAQVTPPTPLGTSFRRALTGGTEQRPIDVTGTVRDWLGQGAQGEALRQAVQPALAPSVRESAYNAVKATHLPAIDEARRGVRGLNQSGQEPYLNSVIDDVTSRLYEHPSSAAYATRPAYATQSIVQNDLDTLAEQLNDPDRLRRWFASDQEANAARRGIPIGEFNAQYKDAVDKYIAAYRNLPTYNRLQKFTKDVAIAIAQRQFTRAAQRVSVLRQIAYDRKPSPLYMPYDRHYDMFKAPGEPITELTPGEPTFYGESGYQGAYAPAPGSPEAIHTSGEYSVPMMVTQEIPGRTYEAGRVHYTYHAPTDYAPPYYSGVSTHIKSELYGGKTGEAFYAAFRRWVEKQHPGIVGGKTGYINPAASVLGQRYLGTAYDPYDYLAAYGEGREPEVLPEDQILRDIEQHYGANVFRELDAPRVPTFAEGVEQRLLQGDLPRRRAFVRALETAARAQENARYAREGRLRTMAGRASPGPLFDQPGPPIAPPPEGRNLPAITRPRPLVPMPEPLRAARPEDIRDHTERIIREAAVKLGTVERIIEDAVYGRVAGKTGLWRGLTRQQQLDLVDQIGDIKNASPETLERWRVSDRTALNRFIHDALVRLKFSTADELRDPDLYLTHSGALYDPTIGETAEDARARMAEPWRPTAWKKGTLQKERVYPTIQEALAHGQLRNPDWQPAQADEEHLRSVLKNIVLEEMLDRLKNEVGLFIPKDEPRPSGWTAKDEHPSLRDLYSPILRDHYFPPEMASLAREFSMPGRLNPQSLMGGVMRGPLAGVMRFFRFWNWIASRLQVALPFFHLGVNIDQNDIAILAANASNPPKAVRGYLTGLFDPEAHTKAVAHRLSQGFASDVPPHLMTRPWSDLSGRPELWIKPWTSEKATRLMNMFTRATEVGTSAPLYMYAEPRTTWALYNGLVEGGVPPNRAYILTRQSIGEPENIGPAWEGRGAQLLQFPRWRIAMNRLWPFLLAKSPALYMAPHRFARAYNISRGAYQQPDPNNLVPGSQPPPSADYLLPPLYLGTNKYGIPQYTDYSSPADLPLRLIDIPLNALGGAVGDLYPRARFGDLRTAGNQALSLALGWANPTIRAIARAGLTAKSEPGEPGTGTAGYRLWDLDAGTKRALQQAVMSTVFGYSPFRTTVNPATGLPQLSGLAAGLSLPQAIGAGLSGYSQFGEQGLGDFTARNRIEHKLRAGIHRLRAAAKEQTQTGDLKGAADSELQAQQLYVQLQQILQQQGLTPNLP